MAVLADNFSHMRNLSTFFFTLLFSKLISLLLRSITNNTAGRKRITDTTQYLELIEEKNPTFIYIMDPPRPQEEEHCTVCLTEFLEGQTMRKLRCQHCFHRDCIDEWLRQYSPACPLCRTNDLPNGLQSRREEHVEIDDDVIFDVSRENGYYDYHMLFYMLLGY